MKKLPILLTICMFFASCSSNNSVFEEETDKETTTQLGKTETPIDKSEWKGADFPDLKYMLLILGDWILTTENGEPTSRFLVFSFPEYPDFSLDKKWYIASEKPQKGEEPKFSYNFSYNFNETQLKDPNGIIYTYKVSSDLHTLSLFDGSNTLKFKKYDNNGVWKWKGDWNTWANPYYTLYKGHYNPIKGIWKVIPNESRYDNQYYAIGNIFFEREFEIYAKDGNIYTDYNTYYGYQYITTYRINDNSLFRLSTGDKDVLGDYYTKYWITGDTLHIQGVDMETNRLQTEYKLIKIKDI